MLPSKLLPITPQPYLSPLLRCHDFLRFWPDNMGTHSENWQGLLGVEYPEDRTGKGNLQRST